MGYKNPTHLVSEYLTGRRRPSSLPEKICTESRFLLLNMYFCLLYKTTHSKKISVKYENPDVNKKSQISCRSNVHTRLSSL